MTGPRKLWLPFIVSLACLTTGQVTAAAEGDSVALVVDWGAIVETMDEPSLICTEAMGYLNHARTDIETDFRSLHACIDRQVRGLDTDSCEEPSLNLQKALTVLDDANNQFATVCP